MKFPIINWISGRLLFEAEIPDDTEERFRLRLALELGVKARANLDGANLDGANLDGANLTGAKLARANLTRANLDGANLARANLTGANLDGANLARANLARANLDGANLTGAKLDGANLDGAKLVGARPIIQLSPIGTESRYVVAYVTDKGLFFKAGCFFGTAAELRAKSASSHGKGSTHNQQYEAFVALAEAHAALWAPAVDAQAAE